MTERDDARLSRPFHRSRFSPSRPRSARRAIGWFVAAVLLLATSAASACPICRDLPGTTVADRLLAGHCVVLARADADEPLAYAPRIVLAGIDDERSIGLLVDSTTRRVLELRPDRHVLLIQSEPGGPLMNEGVLGPEY